MTTKRWLCPGVPKTQTQSSKALQDLRLRDVKIRQCQWIEDMGSLENGTPHSKHRVRYQSDSLNKDNSKNSKCHTQKNFKSS